MAKRPIACIIPLFLLLLCANVVVAQYPDMPPMPPGMPPPPPPPEMPHPGYPSEQYEYVPDPYEGAPPVGEPEHVEMPPQDQLVPHPPIVPREDTIREQPGLQPQPGGTPRTVPPPPPLPRPQREQLDLPTEELDAARVRSERNWPMFKGNASRTGFTEERLQFPLNLIWKHSTEMSPNNPSSPAVVDGIVYFASGRRLYAVHAETGTLRWRYPDEETLTAVIRSSPLVGDELVYFGAGDGRLYAISKTAGSLVWSFATKGIMNSSPVLVDGVIYVGSSDNHLYALEAETGRLVWPGGFRTRDDVSSAPAVSDGLVYFLTNDMVLYAAHTAGGRRRWETRVGAWGTVTSPVVADNSVYVAAGQFLHAFQAKSGRLRWGTKFASTLTTVPTVANGVIYVACQGGKLYAITGAGKLKWRQPADIGARAHGSPIVAGDTVFVGANRGIVAAFDVDTGNLKWRYIIQPTMLDQGVLRHVNITATPVVSDGTLYVLADDGTLHAFRADVPDTTPPQVTMVRPPRNFLMPGAPPVELAAFVVDPGSGIDEDSITMLFNGEPVEHRYFADRGLIYYRTPVTQPIQPLKDGQHRVSLSVSDWAGNTKETSWYFTVNNRIPRRTASAH